MMNLVLKTDVKGTTVSRQPEMSSNRNRGLPEKGGTIEITRECKNKDVEMTTQITMVTEGESTEMTDEVRTDPILT